MTMVAAVTVATSQKSGPHRTDGASNFSMRELAKRSAIAAFRDVRFGSMDERRDSDLVQRN
jgi:hypothetical protein